MKKNDFYESLKEIMDIPDQPLDAETNLKDMEEFDSLVVLQLIALLDAQFGMQFTEEQFKSITTVQSLMDIIGAERFG